MDSGIVFTLLTAFTWAIVDVFRKKLTETMRPLGLAVWLGGGMVPCFLVWMLFSDMVWPPAQYLSVLAVVVLVYVLAQWLFLYAMKVGELSVTIPMLALSPVFTAAIAAWTLGQWPNRTQWAALLAIVVGSLVNGLAGKERRLDRGAIAMVGVALLWSLANVADRVALDWVSPAFHGAAQFTVGTVVLVVALVLMGQAHALRVPKATRGLLFTAIVGISIAFGAQLLAFRAMDVGIVEGIKRGVGIPLAALNGIWFFRERPSWIRLLALAVVTVAVVVLLSVHRT